jgi:ribonucleoside-diphosphate reductase alpha chain
LFFKKKTVFLFFLFYFVSLNNNNNITQKMNHHEDKEEEEKQSSSLNNKKKFYVQKRDGSTVLFDEAKIFERISLLRNDVAAYYHDQHKEFEFSDQDIQLVVERVQVDMFNMITTSQIDELAASCIHECYHQSYASILAGALLISNFQKNQHYAKLDTFSNYIEHMYQNIHPERLEHEPLVSEELYRISKKKGHVINEMIQMKRNYLFSYEGFEKIYFGGYLLCQLKRYQTPRVITKEEEEEQKYSEYKLVPQENPQFMYMRMALGIFGGKDMNLVRRVYNALSLHQISAATPIHFAAGTPNPQMASCFLISSMDDSLDDIYNVFKKVAAVAKNAGGAAVHWRNIRASGSHIKSTNGMSNGLVPMLNVANATARYVDQAGKRPGSQAHYIPIWHPDALEVFSSRRAHGSNVVHPMLKYNLDVGMSKDKSHMEGATFYNNQLFFAVMISDLFMERAKKAFRSTPDVVIKWSFFDPANVRGLENVYGKEFEALYEQYESEKKWKYQMNIRDVVKRIIQCDIETGMPYWLFEDHINHKSQQKNIGMVKSSNLCAEIVEVSTPEETAVCNLSSICLPKCLKYDHTTDTYSFDFDLLKYIVQLAVRMGNQVIDKNKYPTPCAAKSNLRHRPLGIGVMGLADCFALLGWGYDDPRAQRLNRDIAESMYFYALGESADLAEEDGPYMSMHENGGSPLSHGIFHWEMCKNDRLIMGYQPNPQLKLDWEGLRVRIRDGAGVRNSLLIAHMPTASTSQIVGINESFEPFYAMAFCRTNTNSSKYQINRYLIRACQKAGIWTSDLMEQIQATPFSIQDIKEIPLEIRQVFKTYTDLKIKTITDMYAARCTFVDQSSSNNVYFKNTPDLASKIFQYMMYAWSVGLKTPLYYLRTIGDGTTTDFASLKQNQNQTNDENEKQSEKDIVEITLSSDTMCPAGCTTCAQ